MDIVVFNKAWSLVSPNYIEVIIHMQLGYGMAMVTNC